MTKNLIIWGLCLVVAGVLIALLFRPAPTSQPVGLSISEQEDIQHENAFLALKVDSLEKELSKVTRRETSQQEAHVKAVTPFKKIIVRIEKDPEVIKLRDSMPKLDSLLKAKDSLNVRNEDRIAACENAFKVANELNEQVKADLQTRLSNTEQLLNDANVKLDQKEGENKKLRRGRVFRNVLIPVALVGGVLLGVQAD